MFQTSTPWKLIVPTIKNRTELKYWGFFFIGSFIIVTKFMLQMHILNRTIRHVEIQNVDLQV